MNQQPSPIVGNIFAGIIAILFLYYFCKAFYDPKQHINIRGFDYINVGYIENSPIYLIDRKKQSFVSSQLFKDCVDALGALGMKKSEAKNIATRIFKENIPADIQQFLVIALSKK